MFLPTFSPITAAPAYDSDAQAYFDAIITNSGSDPGSTRKSLINTLVVDLKADGVWSKLIACYLCAAHDSVTARINLKTPTNIMTAVNSPTFTTDRGFQGDAVSSYLTTGYIGSDITRTDCTLFAVLNSVSNTSLSMIMGWALNTSDFRVDGNTIGSNRVRIGATTSSIPTTLPTNDTFLAGRRTGTTQDFTVGTSHEGSVTVTDSSAGSSSSINLLNTATAYSDNQISIAGFGQYLTDTELGNLRTRINTYLTGVGAI